MPRHARGAPPGLRPRHDRLPFALDLSGADLRNAHVRRSPPRSRESGTSRARLRRIARHPEAPPEGGGARRQPLSQASCPATTSQRTDASRPTTRWKTMASGSATAIHLPSGDQSAYTPSNHCEARPWKQPRSMIRTTSPLTERAAQLSGESSGGQIVAGCSCWAASGSPCPPGVRPRSGRAALPPRGRRASRRRPTRAPRQVDGLSAAGARRPRSPGGRSRTPTRRSGRTRAGTGRDASAAVRARARTRTGRRTRRASSRPGSRRDSSPPGSHRSSPAGARGREC